MIFWTFLILVDIEPRDSYKKILIRMKYFSFFLVMTFNYLQYEEEICLDNYMSFRGIGGGPGQNL